MENSGHMIDVLLKATGARRRRWVLPELAQLFALLVAASQIHRKQFSSDQNFQPEKQQDVSGTRTSLLVSRFSITPSS